MKTNNWLFRRSILLCVLVVLIAVTSYGQDRERITFNGMVLSGTENAPIPFANIYNLRTFRGVSSAIDGSFFITVLTGDTLRFSSIGYKDFLLIADSSVTKSGIKIFLEKANYMLGPITVNPFMNMDAFRKAFLELPNDSSMKLGLPPAPKMRGPVPGSSAAGTLFNFGGDKNQKDLNRQSASIEQWKKKNEKSGRYNRDFVKQLTGIPDEHVDDLMKFCDLQADAIETVNDYDLMVLVKNCYKGYKEKHPELNLK